MNFLTKQEAGTKTSMLSQISDIVLNTYAYPAVSEKAENLSTSEDDGRTRWNRMILVFSELMFPIGNITHQQVVKKYTIFSLLMLKVNQTLNMFNGHAQWE